MSTLNKRKISNWQPNLLSEEARKRKANQTQSNQKRQNLKTRAEINEKEQKGNKENETNSWFFDKINRIAKLSEPDQENKEREESNN